MLFKLALPLVRYVLNIQADLCIFTVILYFSLIQPVVHYCSRTISDWYPNKWMDSVKYLHTFRTRLSIWLNGYTRFVICLRYYSWNSHISKFQQKKTINFLWVRTNINWLRCYKCLKLSFRHIPTLVHVFTRFVTGNTN